MQADSLKSTALAAKVKNLLTRDPVAEEWYQYQDGYWQRMTTAMVMHQLSKFLDRELAEGYSMALLKNMMSFLQIRLVNTGWGTAKDMLPMMNGVLDLSTMKLLPHSPEYKFQWVLPYAYDAKADCPTIRTYLLDATDGDAEAVESIRAALFFTLLFHLGTQKFMEILGPGGTGKSTLVRLIQELIGKDNCVTTDLKNLEGNKFETAGLYGKRAAFINDSSRYSGEVSQLKAISGEDPLRFEKKGKQQDASFLAECFVFIVSNEPIQSPDYTSGLSRRRVPINFIKQITDADRNKWRSQGGIEAVMKSELSGMLNWVIRMGKDGALAALGGINGQMTKTQLKHLLQTNALATWVEDNCVLIPGAQTYTGTAPKTGDDRDAIEEAAATKLYSNYHQWCQGDGHKPLAVQRYGKALDDLLVNMLKLPVEWLEKDVGGRSFSGISLRNKSHNKIPTPILEETLS